MGKYVDKRLEELGSTRLYDAGFGDDDEEYVTSLFTSCNFYLQYINPSYHLLSFSIESFIHHYPFIIFY